MDPLEEVRHPSFITSILEMRFSSIFSRKSSPRPSISKAGLYGAHPDLITGAAAILITVAYQSMVGRSTIYVAGSGGLQMLAVLPPSTSPPPSTRTPTSPHSKTTFDPRQVPVGFPFTLAVLGLIMVLAITGMLLSILRVIIASILITSRPVGTSVMLINRVKSVNGGLEYEGASGNGPNNDQDEPNNSGNNNDNRNNANGDNDTPDDSSPPDSGDGSSNGDKGSGDDNGSQDNEDEDDSNDSDSLDDSDEQDSTDADDESSEEADDQFLDDLDYAELLDELNELDSLMDKDNKNGNDSAEGDRDDSDNDDDEEGDDPPDDPTPPSTDAEMPEDIPSGKKPIVSQFVLYLNWLVSFFSFFVSLTSFDDANAILKHALRNLLSGLKWMSKSLGFPLVNVQDKVGVLSGLDPVATNGAAVSSSSAPVLVQPALVLNPVDLKGLPIVTPKHKDHVSELPQITVKLIPEQPLPFVIRGEQHDGVDLESMKNIILSFAGWIIMFKVLLGLHEAGQIQVRLGALAVEPVAVVDLARIPIPGGHEEGFDLALRSPLPDDRSDEFDAALREPDEREWDVARWALLSDDRNDEFEAALRVPLPEVDEGEWDLALCIPLSEDEDSDDNDNDDDLALPVPLPAGDDENDSNFNDEETTSVEPNPMEAASAPTDPTLIPLPDDDGAFDDDSAAVEPAPAPVKLNPDAQAFTPPSLRARGAVELAPAQTRIGLNPKALVFTPPRQVNTVPITPAALFTPQPIQFQGEFAQRLPPPVVELVIPPPPALVTTIPPITEPPLAQSFGPDASAMMTTPCPPRQLQGSLISRFTACYSQPIRHAPFATPNVIKGYQNRMTPKDRKEQQLNGLFFQIPEQRQAILERRQAKKQRSWKKYCAKKGYVYHPVVEAESESGQEQLDDSNLVTPSTSGNETESRNRIVD
ncbi:hypothetical protein H0H87_011343 [Tephrocybe sp. NHM501043]|nr:hypothetical protein H0H87_011343 [Tephrocybe sp. NHM501043]